MKIGVIIPNAGADPMRLGIAKMARAAEQAGASSLWVSDHLVQSRDALAAYPYSRDGQMTWSADSDYLECLAVCSFLAAVTTSCTVGSAILILPQRNVLHVAKEAATIDNLSGGRFVLGVGAGWNRAEMEALGYDFERRGKRFDEMLTVLRTAWTGRTTNFAGDEISVAEDLYLLPVPVRPEGPPMLVGGMTEPAIRRAAILGDGWLGLAFVDRWDVDDLRKSAASMREHSVRREKPAHWVLKLHSPAEQVGQLPARIEEAHMLGFQEFAVEVPWSLGIDEAVSVTEDLVRRFS